MNDIINYLKYYYKKNSNSYFKFIIIPMNKDSIIIMFLNFNINYFNNKLMNYFINNYLGLKLVVLDFTINFMYNYLNNSLNYLSMEALEFSYILMLKVKQNNYYMVIIITQEVEVVFIHNQIKEHNYMAIIKQVEEVVFNHNQVELYNYMVIIKLVEEGEFSHNQKLQELVTYFKHNWA